ncbi:TIGR02449 family protein [Hahella sp. SMD15-11]|uniref:TIGR02449 family protein n=1 Tax=Thermohahella caldifontis TaxID=3142973 RepID=A0AB39UUX9_9GAMM
MEQNPLDVLNQRIDQLIDRVRKLEQENAQLRQAQDELQKERARLLQKNDMARTKIEAMISRLKAMEQR